MSARIQLFNKRASLYTASAAARFHYGVQNTKFGREFRNMGTIKGKTEKGYSKTQTPKTTDLWMAYSKIFTSTFSKVISAITALITINGVNYNMYVKNEQKIIQNKQKTIQNEQKIIDRSTKLLTELFRMSKKEDLLEYDRLMDILDRTRTIDSDCVKCIDNNNSTKENKELKKLIDQVAPKESKLSLKKEFDAPEIHDVLLKNWVEDRKYDNLKVRKDMEALRDFLLIVHDVIKSYQKSMKVAIKAGLGFEDCWLPFIEGTQEGKILKKVVLKLYNFYNPEKKEKDEYIRIVSTEAWEEALQSRRKYVQMCIGGGGYGDEKIARSEDGKDNWKGVLAFLRGIDPRFDEYKNPDAFAYLISQEPMPGKDSGSKD